MPSVSRGIVYRTLLVRAARGFGLVLAECPASFVLK